VETVKPGLEAVVERADHGQASDARTVAVEDESHDEAAIGR
jgi:hypothetical protein